MAKLLHLSKEQWVYICFWSLLFLAPLGTMYILSKRFGDGSINWEEVFHIWKFLIVYLICFLIHNSLLAPILVYKHKVGLYISLIVCMTVVFTLYRCISSPEFQDGSRGAPEPRPVDQNGKAILNNDEEKPTARPWENEKRELHKNGVHKNDRHPRPRDPRTQRVGGRPFLLPPDIFSVLMLIGVFGMNLGAKLFFKMEKERIQMQLLEKKNVEQQLEYLRYQISPHFFMNTLNNIHALVDIDPEKAKITILELSKMMRYLLYEASRPLVPIEKEKQFLLSYVQLMRLRFTDQVEIIADIPEKTPSALIPPLLTINFVENAFKHGISYQSKSFIHIKVRFSEQACNFECVNSKHKESTEEHGGVGLTNARKRLDLLFGENYTLDIADQDDTYEVSLLFPLTPAGDNQQA
ncbi:MAG: histidine kinase [Prevotella sp.]|jgi:hypothetical protein